MQLKKCEQCNIVLTSRFQQKYCSNKCQIEQQYDKYIKDWKQEVTKGKKNISTKNISKYLKRYILEKYDEQCAQCGWKEVNSKTGHLPLEIDHIDGNSENNNENNLRLLCPNCHSLTSTFKNLNRGNGRQWRKTKNTIT